MAEQVESFPGGRDKHEWTKFLNGKVWRLVEGKDFNGVIHSFRTQCYMAAKRNGKTLKTISRSENGEKCLYIQAQEIGDASDPVPGTDGPSEPAV